MATIATERRQQRGHALDRANEVRLGIAAVRDEIRGGRLRVADALYDPRASAMPVLALLLERRRWGPKRARRLLRRSDIRVNERNRVDTLTERQRGLIAEACR